MTTRKHRIGSSSFPAACEEKSFTFSEKPPTDGGPIWGVENDIVANALDFMNSESESDREAMRFTVVCQVWCIEGRVGAKHSTRAQRVAISVNLELVSARPFLQFVQGVPGVCRTNSLCFLLKIADHTLNYHLCRSRHCKLPLKGSDAKECGHYEPSQNITGTVTDAQYGVRFDTFGCIMLTERRLSTSPCAF